MVTEKLKQVLKKSIPFELTIGQEKLVEALSRFAAPTKENKCLIVKGYAGTGKTTILSYLVKALPSVHLKSVLLAPTGRAAKVLSNYSSKKALTIHKKIYQRVPSDEGSYVWALRDNLHTNTIFIVDESSMIGDQSGISDGGLFNRNLMDDLFTYVYNGKNCNLILIGDDAQLPPIGIDVSPALDLEEIRSRYDVIAGRIELSEVVRQKQDSGILVNATNIRTQQKDNPDKFPKFTTLNFEDITPISGNELQEYLDQEISSYGIEGTIVVCRSNKRANQFNQQIRNRILWREEELSAGDLIMVVKNNYHWLGEDSSAGFIANGDIVEITKILGNQELYGFRFSDVMVKLVDYPDIESFECKIMLDVLYSEQPNLARGKVLQLYQSISEDYLDEKNKQKRKKKIFEDPFFNALQVKFAYAVTCHKSQGGQWPVVFVDQGFLTSDMINKEYLRWLYTAITRAEEKVYLVNFNSEFIDKDYI